MHITDPVKVETRSEGYRRPRLLRPLGEGFWPDVIGALAFISGVALAGLLFDFDGLLGAVVGATAVVIARAVHRRLKHEPTRSPGT